MLIGARTIEEMTPLQAATYRAIAAGPRGSVPDPFLAMLDAPHLAEAIQAVGAAIRFQGAMTVAVREVAILATAGAVGSGYEWDFHAPIARACGVSDAIIGATINGESEGLDLVSVAIIAVCRTAVFERRICAEALEQLVEWLGREVATEIVAVSGYYQMLALFLSAGALDHEVGRQSERRE